MRPMLCSRPSCRRPGGSRPRRELNPRPRGNQLPHGPHRAAVQRRAVVCLVRTPLGPPRDPTTLSKRRTVPGERLLTRCWRSPAARRLARRARRSAARRAALRRTARRHPPSPSLLPVRRTPQTPRDLTRDLTPSEAATRGLQGARLAQASRQQRQPCRIHSLGVRDPTPASAATRVPRLRARAPTPATARLLC